MTTTVRAALRGRWSLALLGGLSAVLLAACGSSSSSSPTTTAQPATTTPAAVASTTSTTSATPSPVYEVRTGTVHGLGTVLVDGQGLTLYMFMPDRQSGQSTCYNACAQAWPPLLLPTGASTPLAGPGVQTSLLGTTRRTDGTVQVTYDKWPLYTWVTDSEPGQATGQGLNNLGGLWYVLSPQGKVITTRT